MKKVNLFMCLIGAIGMLFVMVLLISGHKTDTAGSLISALGVEMVFAAMFIAGYLAITRKE